MQNSLVFFIHIKKHCGSTYLSQTARDGMGVGAEEERNNLVRDSFKSNRLHLGAQMLKILINVWPPFNSPEH